MRTIVRQKANTGNETFHTSASIRHSKVGKVRKVGIPSFLTNPSHYCHCNLTTQINKRQYYADKWIVGGVA